jgi:hypothetical protein
MSCCRESETRTDSEWPAESAERKRKTDEPVLAPRRIGGRSPASADVTSFDEK